MLGTRDIVERLAHQKGVGWRGTGKSKDELDFVNAATTTNLDAGRG
jgi:hypothetical protein